MGETGSSLTSPYREFSAQEWSQLREGTELTLNEDDLVKLRGLGETISLDEVEEIYLPLSRLLNFYVEATQGLHGARQKPRARGHSVAFGRSFDQSHEGVQCYAVHGHLDILACGMRR